MRVAACPGELPAGAAMDTLPAALGAEIRGATERSGGSIMAELPGGCPWFSPFLGVMYVLCIGLYRGKAWYA